ncbi:histidine kinase [Actinopolymorpha sp. B17G11]|uniref:sensor histidine kinase n=1 Tax=Actinopolymorpha sp. B17G11 TaxID=3160861 RepID=UPI0032E4F159
MQVIRWRPDLARPRPWVVIPAVVVAVASLAATAYVVHTGSAPSQVAGLIGSVEVVALLLLLAFVVRWAPARTAYLVGTVIAAAQTLWIVRFLPTEELTPLSVIGGCALWSLASVGAVVTGGYPRIAAVRLDRSVTAARQAQRLDLAHDLHDFVAHDVSGIVAQAQAARFVHADDPARLRAALERIETAGLQALSAMDDLVAMLADSHDSHDHRPPLARLSDLPDLVERFRVERPQSHVSLAQDERSQRLVLRRPQVEMTAYRIVVEALTNIRRHAPSTEQVTIEVRVDDKDVLQVRVSNDVGHGARITSVSRTHGGRGLLNLRERVRALGGDLNAGPDEHGRWTVAACMPISRAGANRG